MPRTIQLHPLSLLVGVGFALLGVVAMGQVPAAKRPAAAHDSGLLQVAHPRDWVVVEEGTGFVVPNGRFLVVTGVGNSDSSGSVVQLRINGQQSVTTWGGVGLGVGMPSVKPIQVGLRAPAGALVEVDDSGSANGRAWGYLVDA